MGKFNRHLDEVVNKCWNYAGRCENHKDEVMNAILGLTGEAGECADVLKKYYFHTKKADSTHYKKELLKEMGDVIFYWLKLRDLFNLSNEEILDMNRAKLESRHPEMGKVTERFGKDAIR